MALIVWKLDLQLPVQSVLMTTKVVFEPRSWRGVPDATLYFKKMCLFILLSTNLEYRIQYQSLHFIYMYNVVSANTVLFLNCIGGVMDSVLRSEAKKIDKYQRSLRLI